MNIQGKKEITGVGQLNISLKALTASGPVDRATIRDPMQPTLVVRRHVECVFRAHGVSGKSQLERAELIFRSTIGSNVTADVNGQKVFGLKKEDGGLEVEYNDDKKHPMRAQLGCLFPDDIINSSQTGRIALCQEHAALLCSMVRSAGFNAGTKNTANHTYLIAELDGQKYRLDGSKAVFAATGEVADKDDLGLSIFYLSSGGVLSYNRKFEIALECFRTVYHLTPELPTLWLNLGALMAMAGNYGDAFACWEKIHGPSLDHLSSQKNRASLLYKSKKFEEALTVLSDAAKMYPDDSVVWEWIGRIQQKQGRHADALKAFWKAMKKNRLNEDVIKGIDTSLRALGRHKEADELRAMSAGQKKQE